MGSQIVITKDENYNQTTKIELSLKPGTTLEQAQNVARELRKLIEKWYRISIKWEEDVKE